MMQAADSLEQVRRIVSDAVATTGAPVGKMFISLGVGIIIGAVVSYSIGVSRGRGLRGSLKEWIVDLNTTNYRIVITQWVAVGFLAALVVAMVLHAVWPRVVGTLQEGVIDSVLIALTAWLGLDVGQFLAKRSTQDATKNPGTKQNQPPIATEDKRTGEMVVAVPTAVKPVAQPASEPEMAPVGVQLPADPNKSAVQSFDPGA